MNYNKITRAYNRALYMAKQHSPEILMGVGTITVIGGAILTGIKATKHAEIKAKYIETLETVENTQSDVENGKLAVETYSPEDYKKDKIVTTIKYAADIAKNYAPGVVLTGIGIGCYFSAYGVLKARNLVLATAYAAVNESYTRYRKYVKENVKNGEELDKAAYGHASSKIKHVYDDGCTAMYDEELIGNVFEFNSFNANWQKNMEYNLFFLKSVQDSLNDMLKVRGHVFLNEVYEALGFVHTAEGALKGWIYNDNNTIIDLGVYTGGTNIDEYYKGECTSIMLNINVEDNPIYNRI